MRTFVAAFMLSWSLCAHAQPVEPQSTVTAPVVDAQVMLREASKRIGQADYVGAKIQLVLVLEALRAEHQLAGHPERWLSGNIDDVAQYSAKIQTELFDVLYLYAGVLQEEHNLKGALKIFESLLSQDQSVIRYEDILFRCATAHSLSGNETQANHTLVRVTKNLSVSKTDAAKLRLTRQMFRFRMNPSVRGTHRLHKHMSRLPDVYFQSYRGRLRVELIQYLLDVNATLDFKGTQRRIVRHHRLRSKNHQASVSQLERIIQLQQPIPVANALMLISEGLMHTGDALHAASVPETLSPEQKTMYQNQIQVYVKNTWVNALRYSTEGVHLSTRLNLGEPIKTKMASLKEAISTRIEQLN